MGVWTITNGAENCPGLHAAAMLAAYINRNATPRVILIRTELGDDGLHPVVTVVPKRELMNFDWGCRVSQEPSFQKSEGAASVFVRHAFPSRQGICCRALL